MSVKCRKKVTLRIKHLLLAEDNELNAEIAEVLFGDEGATIVIARNGQEAIDEFMKNPLGTFNAVLMDIVAATVAKYCRKK